MDSRIQRSQRMNPPNNTRSLPTTPLKLKRKQIAFAQPQGGGQPYPSMILQESGLKSRISEPVHAESMMNKRYLPNISHRQLSPSYLSATYSADPSTNMTAASRAHSTTFYPKKDMRDEATSTHSETEWTHKSLNIVLSGSLFGGTNFSPKRSNNEQQSAINPLSP